MAGRLEREADFAGMAELVRAEESSRRALIATPFGERRIFYADLTATGRHLQFLERWFARLRPYYANTHTQISSTGRFMTSLREDARRIVHRSVGADEDDEVLFVGSGATAAVNKLIGLLGLRIPEPLERRHGLAAKIPRARRPLVLVGPYEHHSNELPWLESIAEVVEIGLDANGAVDAAEIEARLARVHGGRLKIGSFSAASNVTGVLTDVHALARVLHRGGALAFFDYAAAGPYVPIDMHPPDPEERIDALFLSPHKWVGGAEGSGLLVANRALFLSRRPERPGGGTVEFVAGPGHGDVDYARDLAVREEGGTPDILGDIRVGAAFLVKERAGARAILAHETALARRAAERLARHPAIRLLGPATPRLAIVPFTVEGMHHELVSLLLDHLFGIQNRAGCSCAGPYGHRLLGITPRESERIRALVRRGIHGVKPGWTRLSVPWYLSESEIEYLFQAVEFVATHGKEFIPLYRLHWGDAAWRHVDGEPEPAPLALTWESLRATGPAAPPGPPDEQGLREERKNYLTEARRLAARLRRRWAASPPAWNPPTGDAEVDALARFRYVHAGGLPIASGQDGEHVPT